jgi:hypothetical protein
VLAAVGGRLVQGHLDRRVEVEAVDGEHAMRIFIDVLHNLIAASIADLLPSGRRTKRDAGGERFERLAQQIAVAARTGGVGPARQHRRGR